MRSKKLFVTILVLMIGVVGCQGLESPSTPDTTPLPTATPPLQQITPTATEVGEPAATPVSFSGLTTLTLWVPDFLNPYEGEENAALLLEEIEAFSRMHRDIQVEVLVKKAEGPGGLYDLLNTASQAAPDVLPDILLLNADDLKRAAAQDKIQSMPPMSTSPTGTFPIATQATHIFTDTYGIPLLMDYQQTVYNPRLALTPPLTWTAVLSGGYSLLFPAAPEEDLANDALLIAYLGAGGSIRRSEEELLLERTYLEQTYGFFKDLLESDQLTPQKVLVLTDAFESWEAYQQGGGTMAVVPAGHYWSSDSPVGAAGWFPSPEGEPLTLGHLWSLALVTEEPDRQEAAMELLDWLAAPERIAELSQQVGMLPTNEEALALWPLLPEDYAFVVTLSQVAQLPPATDVDRLVRRALQAGLEMLLENEEATAEQAASHAMTVLRK
jgi:maltose-binding protein MalE